nr:uncharacterized protein LOC129383467 [Dermacentor andersoni]
MIAGNRFGMEEENRRRLDDRRPGVLLPCGPGRRSRSWLSSLVHRWRAVIAARCSASGWAPERLSGLSADRARRSSGRRVTGQALRASYISGLVFCQPAVPLLLRRDKVWRDDDGVRRGRRKQHTSCIQVSDDAATHYSTTTVMVTATTTHTGESGCGQPAEANVLTHASMPMAPTS